MKRLTALGSGLAAAVLAVGRSRHRRRVRRRAGRRSRRHGERAEQQLVRRRAVSDAYWTTTRRTRPPSWTPPASRRSSSPSSSRPTAAAAARPGAAPARSPPTPRSAASSPRSGPRAATSRSPSAATAAPSSARRAPTPPPPPPRTSRSISKYQLHAIDFDLEEPEYENTAAVANEIGAAKILQQNNPGLYISVTTAGTAAGTGWFGQQMLNEAKSLGFTPDNFSIMPFDGGFSGAASQTGRAHRVQRAAEDHLRLGHRHRVRPRGLLRHERPQRLGRVLLPGGLPDRAGLRDQPRHGPLHLLVAQPRPPVQPAGQQRLDVRHVQQRAAGRVGLREVLGGVRRRDAAVDAADHHAAPPPRPAAAAARVAAWSASAVYIGGNEVSHSGHKWKAKWWTTNEEPGTTGEFGRVEGRGRLLTP